MTITSLSGYVTGRTYEYNESSSEKNEGLDGVVYPVNGAPLLLVKILKPSTYDKDFLSRWKLRPINRFERFEALCETLGQINWEGKTAPRAAFPLDVLVNESNIPVGYLLPRAQGISWEKAFSERIGLRNLVTACASLARTLQNLHLCGICIGDWNPNNFLLESGITTIIDTDALHVQFSGTVYPNPFHFPMHSPPEMRQPEWSAWNLSPEQDYWGLAVLMYRLLVGIHPFYSGDPSALSYEEAVAIGIDGRLPHFQIRPDNGGTGRIFYNERWQRLFFWELPAELRSLFMKTFRTGYSQPSERSTTHEWVTALEKINYSTCKKGHAVFWAGKQSPRLKPRCPICDVEE